MHMMTYLRMCARARARQLAGVVDAYLHTLPPPARKAALDKFAGIWVEHHRMWANRIDNAIALEAEHELNSFDWLETEAALQTLARDLEQGQKDAN
jgi:hypothetical protein